MSKTHQVTLLPGDWVGPETCEVVKAVFAAAGVDIAWDTFVWPEDRRLDALLASCRRTGVMLKAKLDGARTAGQLPPTVELRKRLGAWVTIRAVRALPGTRARFPGIDLVVIRETSEDIYSGLEHEVADGVYEAVKVTTRAACERVARFAYDYARAHGRKKVSIVHKANIMKRSDGLFLRTAQEIAEDYPEIETEDVIVDALCMRLVRDPLRFDVLLAGNLFGDIVSDLASGLGGGISASPSISIADGVRSFENPHGKVPELTGTGKASPIPMLVPAILMLEHLGEADAARRTWSALEGVLEDGLRTVDLGGEAGCAEVQRALIARLTA